MSSTPADNNKQRTAKGNCSLGVSAVPLYTLKIEDSRGTTVMSLVNSNRASLFSEDRFLQPATTKAQQRVRLAAGRRRNGQHHGDALLVGRVLLRVLVVDVGQERVELQERCHNIKSTARFSARAEGS